MSVVGCSATPPTPCEIEHVDLRKIAVAKPERLPKDPGLHKISIKQYHPELASVIGAQPCYSLLLSTWDSSKNPFFHAGCIYVVQDDELYVTSNLLQSTSSSKLPVILISKVQLLRDDSGTVTSVRWQKLRPPPSMPMPAGGTCYRDGMLFCSQGTLSRGTGGIYYMPRGQPPAPVVTNYSGHDFNSVHDVAAATDGSLWFTDPCDGFENGFRQEPQLACHVYRYDPATGDLRVMADGLSRPHGIALSPDERTVYMSDTDSVRAEGIPNQALAATIYAFDVITRSGSPSLANKRVFAHALTGVPLGIMCDTKGIVYGGCTDGVIIWNPAGSMLGVIEVPGGVTSLSTGRDNELFLCDEERLWRLELGRSTEEREAPMGM
ncbi:hypothetical protein VTK56DRAFT_1132 [Thermocarpiscus australiensis]